MRRFVLPTIAVLVLGAGIFAFSRHNEVNLTPEVASIGETSPSPAVTPTEIIDPKTDLPNQPHLANPPKLIKAVYATSWSAGSSAKMDYLINLIKTTELNAIVIDLKDFSGTVTYDIKLPEVVKAGARQVRIPKINALIKKLHDNNIYVIGRVTDFQDPILAKARPDLAIKNSATGKTWTDKSGLAWIDPGSQDAWKYIVSIAQDATARGFDEINFDYLRFPSDGNLSLMQYPHTDLTKEKKSDVIRSFFQYLHANMSNTKISADVFGLTTVNTDDMGIGQVIEYAFENFDYVAPMVYPSHFGPGLFGYKNPAQYPYEIIQASMESAYNRLITYNQKQITLADAGQASSSSAISDKLPISAKLRPWLQSFDLGATYDAAKIKAQITATTDSLCKYVYGATTDPKTKKTTTTKTCESLSQAEINKIYNGWMLWDPRNNYIKASLQAEGN